MTTYRNETRETVDLCVKNVPSHFNENMLKKLFSFHGTVINIQKPTTSSFYFIRYASRAEAENAIEKLSNNPFGLSVDVAVRKNDPNRIIRPETDPSSMVRRCVVCEQIGSMSCQRCGDCYCSTKCQTYDWNYERHHQRCFPMPPLILIADIQNFSPSTNGNGSVGHSPPQKGTSPKSDMQRLTSLRNGVPVILTHVNHWNDSWHIYIRPFEAENDFRYTLRNINEEGIHAKPLNAPPYVGDVVIAPFDGDFYRAKVCERKSNCFRVIFIDFGNQDWLPLEELRMISNQSRNAEIFVRQVLLKDVPLQFNGNALNYLNDLVQNDTKLVLKCDDGICDNDKYVELLDGMTNINKTMAQFINHE